MFSDSFIESLLHFTRSIERVDDVLANKVRDLLIEHLQNSKDIIYFEVMKEVPAAGEDQKILRTIWRVVNGDSKLEGISTVIRDKDNKYSSHGSLAYSVNKPLWIVDRNKGDLKSEQAELIDLWSQINVQTEAKYKEPPEITAGDKRVKTSILIPFKYQSKKVGVFDLEAKEYIEPVEMSKKELITLGDALGTIYGLLEAVRYPESLTEKAMNRIKRNPGFHSGLLLHKPRLFLSYSAKTKKGKNAEVVIAIQETLNYYKDKIEVLDWAKINDAGNINEHILRGILSANYGICYFSEEQTPECEMEYTDNPNVIFEAGMIQAIVNVNPDEEPRGWIPIREKNSPPAPFDYAQNRMIIVPREDEGGGFKRERFIKTLKERIEALMT